jgi:hypothetical protein
MPLGQIAGGIAALFNARSQKRQAAQFGKLAGNWQDYQVSDQAKQMLGEAQARRGAQMPGMGIAQAQQLGTQASLLGAASRQGTGGSNFMALAAALGGQAANQGLGLAQQQAQFNMQGQNELNQARGVMMGEEQKQFQNQLNRFQFYKQAQMGLEQARLQNITQGISSIGAGVTDALMTAGGAGLLGKGNFGKAFGFGADNNSSAFNNWFKTFKENNPGLNYGS